MSDFSIEKNPNQNSQEQQNLLAAKNLTNSVRDSFDKIDTNGSGRISQEEIMAFRASATTAKDRAVGELLNQGYDFLKNRSNDDWFFEKGVSKEDITKFLEQISNSSSQDPSFLRGLRNGLVSGLVENSEDEQINKMKDLAASLDRLSCKDQRLDVLKVPKSTFDIFGPIVNKPEWVTKA